MLAIIFIHLMLELLTQFSALHNKNKTLFVKVDICQIELFDWMSNFHKMLYQFQWHFIW